MKNLFKNLMLVAVAAMGFTACEQVIDDVNAGIDENTVTMTFVAEAPESRTSVSIEDNKAKYSWSTGDKVGFYYVDVKATDKKKKGSNPAVIADDGTATFTAEFDKITDASAYNIGAFYPSESWVGHVDTNPFNNVNVKIPAGQALTDGSFDPEADLMMSKPFMGVALSSDDVKTLEFTRIAAIGKMNLKLEDMVAGEVIKSVKFSLAEGTNFTGHVSLDLENSSYSIVEAKASNAVTISGELAANADRTAIYFTCFPGEYSGGYTIEVTTDKATYSKIGTLSKVLSFTAGDVLSFNATATGREEIVVEAGHVVDTLDLTFTGMPSATSYGDWSDKTGASNAVYAGNSAGDKSSIQLRSDKNTSGIVTTTSGGNVRKITVDWNSGTTNGRVLNIYGKHASYSAATDLYDTTKQGDQLGTIVYGTSTVLEINGDYEYIGLRSNSGAMYINEIKIEWESDGKAAQSLSFSQSACTITMGDPFDVPTLSGAQTTVTYTSSNTDVATVDENTGAVTIVGVGTTTITASAEATDAYRAAEASYTLTIKEKATGGTSKFVKVTSALSDWSGTYLIVYETGNVAFDGSLTNLDTAKKTVSVKITDGEIAATDAMKAITFDIAKSGSNYTIKSKSGRYIGQTSNANGLKYSTSTTYNHTITFKTENEIDLVSGGAYLRYNSASDQLRFRYYKSGSYTGQKAIQLYKLSE